jgi:hypothetical protein
LRSATHAVVAASAGLLLSVVAPLARDSLTNPFTIVIAVVCTILMLRNVSAVWLVLGASAAGLVAAILA